MTAPRDLGDAHPHCAAEESPTGSREAARAPMCSNCLTRTAGHNSDVCTRCFFFPEKFHLRTDVEL